MSRTWTVGRLARRFGLSRSTLLYYDTIGLLRPTDRSQGDYRIYDEAALHRLERICLYRQAGIPLAEIRQILDSPTSAPAEALERRLAQLDQEISSLRRQQHLVASLLKKSGVLIQPGITKEVWVNILKNLGFSQSDMDRWHIEFERSAPNEHQEFLEYLGIPEKEIAMIRGYARGEGGRGKTDG